MNVISRAHQSLGGGRLRAARPQPADGYEGPVQVVPSEGHQKYGAHKLVFGKDDAGRDVVWKHNGLVINELKRCPFLLDHIFPAEQRLQDMREILGSHIMRDVFGLPSVVYREGYWNDGTRHDGVVSQVEPGLRTLKDMSVDDIKDPDTAVAINVVKGWMGDWDSVGNNGNAWFTADGHPLGGDYGWSLRDGVTYRGFPNGNARVLEKYARPDNVQPWVDRICALSDHDIHAMVDAIGQRHISGWTKEDRTFFAGFLIRNRDRLKKAEQNPFLAYWRKDDWVESPSHRRLLDYPVGFSRDIVQYRVNQLAHATHVHLSSWAHRQWMKVRYGETS